MRKNISDVKAVGQMIVVEMLTAQEAANTRLYLGNNAEVPPQAYVYDIGPMVEVDKWGIKVGDRVLLQGKYVPVPKFKEGREMGIVQMHDIKCVFGEESDE